jgi:hypothetical protein
MYFDTDKFLTVGDTAVIVLIWSHLHQCRVAHIISPLYLPASLLLQRLARK